MCIVFICFPGCDVINFEINHIILIKPFFCMAIKSRQNFKFLENEKSFKGEISIFHHFLRALNCQKMSQPRECSFNSVGETLLSKHVLSKCSFNSAILSLSCASEMFPFSISNSISFCCSKSLAFLSNRSFVC